VSWLLDKMSHCNFPMYTNYLKLLSLITNQTGFTASGSLKSTLFVYNIAVLLRERIDFWLDEHYDL